MTKKVKEKAFLAFWLLLSVAVVVHAERRQDSRCISMMGLPLEGSADSLTVRLKKLGFTEWGVAENGDGLHFRGNYYGIRGKLFVAVDGESGLVSSASVTAGPYSSVGTKDKNLKYFLRRLQQDYGEFTLRGGAYFSVNDNGVIKLSDAETDNGAWEVKVFYYPTSAYYKDALSRGLKGRVMEVVTDNPVAEEPVEQFDRYGQQVNRDLIFREYDEYGYLRRAYMPEKDGEKSELTYTYDINDRLVKRTLTNTGAGIRYVNEYTYDDDENVVRQSQKVFDRSGQCVMSINLQNDYQEFDDNGNWTRNSLKLTYWDKESGTQQNTAVQKRTISYWDE